MLADDLPLSEIAILLGRDPADVEIVYHAWLDGWQARNRAIVPDIKLLAALSGLSTASVSNFLRSKSGSISQANADRLAQLVDWVGYVPRGAAQNLREQRRRVVGIAALLSSISPGFYLEIISGAKCETASRFPPDQL